MCDGEGLGELFVDATWAELPSKCLVMLKPTSCEDEGSGDAEVIDVGEEGSGEEVGSEEAASSTGFRSSRAAGILRSAGFGRSYGILSLSKFYTSFIRIFSCVLLFPTPSRTQYSGGVISGIVSTPYDKFSTLPYLQLPGWTATDAIIIAISMVVMYYVYAYINASSVSLAPLERSCSMKPR
eukprot:TRINITY_DN37029_c0_g1_i1.p1 TRINITY_DN37029_c0_g1~~TRINITY_DN37029_c0_g1_i1.p1  ORF type:complete len:182 (+),score=28.43 TRINITY_DN37029_c0_g1_i1:271-816(+)